MFAGNALTHAIPARSGLGQDSPEASSTSWFPAAPCSLWRVCWCVSGRCPAGICGPLQISAGWTVVGFYPGSLWHKTLRPYFRRRWVSSSPLASISRPRHALYRDASLCPSTWVAPTCGGNRSSRASPSARSIHPRKWRRKFRRPPGTSIKTPGISLCSVRGWAGSTSFPSGPSLACYAAASLCFRISPPKTVRRSFFGGWERWVRRSSPSRRRWS